MTAREATRPVALMLAALVVVLLVALALGVVAARAPDSAGQPAESATIPVQQRTLSCLALPDGARSRVLAVGAPDLPAAGAEAGRATVRGPGIRLDEPGGWAVLDRPGAGRAGPPLVQLAAAGAAAPTVSAVEASLALDGSGGGLAVQRCAEPARRWWFVGAGSTPSRDGTLLLSAPAGTDAVVDVVLRGPEGVLPAVRTEDLRVDAGDVVALTLSDVVAGTDDVAVEVEASQGRVVAALADTWGGGLRPQGTDWLPAAAAPARTVLVPGIVSTGTAPLLVVANPQEQSVVARPALVTGNGRASVPGAESVQVPAGGVATVPLPKPVDPGTSVEVRADGPVTAAVRLDDGSDVGLPAGAPPLAGVAAVPLGLGAVPAAPTLTLAAVLVDPDTRAVRSRSVRLGGFSEDGQQLGAGRVEVPAGTSLELDPGRALDLPRGRLRDLAYLLVEPGAAGAAAVPLVGAVTLRGPAGLAVLPLQALVTEVTIPALVPRVVPPGT